MNENLDTTPARRLETKICSRCGGEGKLWHFTSVMGGVCFKCNGSKRLYTKRGRAACDYLNLLRCVRANTLKVGQLVRETTMAGVNATVTAFMTVDAVEPLTMENANGWSLVDGKRTIPENHLKVTLGHPKWGGLNTQYPADKMVRVACSAEFKAATLKIALDFQDTLTKGGKTTKRTEKFLESDPVATLPPNILSKDKPE